MKSNDSGSLSRYQREAISVYEAQEAVLERISGESKEIIKLEDAYRKRSAKLVQATMPIPYFRRSNMDGYAVRSIDVQAASIDNPAKLRVVGQIACGDAPTARLASGEAMRIMTGAQVPEGADAVVKVEATSGMATNPAQMTRETLVYVYSSVSPEENITAIGTELEIGQVIVEKGQLLEAGELALLAMFGQNDVEVFCRPKVAVIPTGKELLNVQQELTTGKIWNSNSYMLLAQIYEAGAEPILMQQVGDCLDSLSAAIEEAIRKEADAIITIGGVSVGDHDIMYDYTNQWNGELLFNKLSMRPGSPTTVGIFHGGKPLFALSGNPSACYVGFEMLVRPALLKMQGAEQPFRRSLRARLAEPYRIVDTYDRFVRGIMQVDEQGVIWVRPTAVDRSNATISIRDANCLFVIPSSPLSLDKGVIVDLIPLTTL